MRADVNWLVVIFDLLFFLSSDAPWEAMGKCGYVVVYYAYFIHLYHHSSVIDECKVSGIII